MLDERLNAGVRTQASPKPVAEETQAENEITLLITHPVGLHARPATIFVKTAAQFSSKIWIEHGDKKGNAKSILQVLSMGADNGSTIKLSAEGEDAQAALNALKELVESNFGGVD
jgi:phosphotransferase system HPr (HPr) family protein